MNLRQVCVLEKMKIENALFCIISISLPSAIWADRVAFSNFLHFAKNKNALDLLHIFFFENSSSKGTFRKIKKKIRIFGAVFRNSRYLRMGVLKCLAQTFLRRGQQPEVEISFL